MKISLFIPPLIGVVAFVVSRSLSLSAPTTKPDEVKTDHHGAQDVECKAPAPRAAVTTRTINLPQPLAPNPIPVGEPIQLPPLTDLDNAVQNETGETGTALSELRGTIANEVFKTSRSCFPNRADTLSRIRMVFHVSSTKHQAQTTGLKEIAVIEGAPIQSEESSCLEAMFRTGVRAKPLSDGEFPHSFNGTSVAVLTVGHAKPRG